jgi:hypothetical protein
MIRLLTAVLLFASFDAVAQTNVPNDLNDGEVANAEEVMQNFQALEDAIDNNTQSIGNNTTSLSGKVNYPDCVGPKNRYPLLIWDETLGEYTCGEVTDIVTPCGGYSCVKYCPIGTVRLSGGCKFVESQNALFTLSAPNLGNGWRCEIGPAAVSGENPFVEDAYLSCLGPSDFAYP